MYEELVERLHKRIALTTAGSPLQDDLLQAADAIEQWDSYYQSLICARCGDVERKPRTNLDQFRSLAAEEIAALIAEGCPPGTRCHCFDSDEILKRNCAACWAKWFAREAEKFGLFAEQEAGDG